MAISFLVSNDSWSEYVADGALNLPGSPQSGDRMFIFATWKTFTITASVANWTAVGAEFTDGAVAAGNGTGSMKVQCWYRDWQSGDSNPTLDFSANPGQALANMGIFRKGANETWDTPAIANAAIAAASNWTATANANPGVTANDLLMAFYGFRDDSATMSAQTLTQTGVTFGPVTKLSAVAAHGSATSGNDASCDMVYSIASSGTGSAPPVATGTISASETGAALFIRQRVTTVAERVPRFTSYPQLLAH
jgi:hypothetical protein